MNKKLYMRIASMLLILFMVVTESYTHAVMITPGNEKDALVKDLKDKAQLYKDVANFLDKKQYKCDDTDTDADAGATPLSTADIAKVKSLFLLAEKDEMDVGSLVINRYVECAVGVGGKIHSIVCHARPAGIAWGQWNVSTLTGGNIKDMIKKTRDELRPLLIAAWAIKSEQATHLENDGELYSNEAIIVNEAIKPAVNTGKRELIDYAKAKLDTAINATKEKGELWINDTNNMLDQQKESASGKLDGFSAKLLCCGLTVTGVAGACAIAVHTINCKISSAIAAKQTPRAA